MRTLLRPILLFVCSALLPQLLTAEVILNSSESVSRTGHFQLSWQHDEEGEVFVLQQADDPHFSYPKTIYRGPDLARTISGLPNGTYYYRVSPAGAGWSDPISVKVDHYKLSTALTFLGLGAMVFVATAILIIRGHLKHRDEA